MSSHGSQLAQKVLLAEKWDEDTDPTGWFMSEKLDGVRALYDGNGHFYSRNGNLFPSPPWFSQGFPKFPLDGELWCGRGEFQQAVSIVRNEKRADDWKFVKYLVFDIPMHPGKFEERYEELQHLITPAKTQNAVPVGQVKCTGKAHVLSEMRKVIDQGGEGLMLRQPGSRYQHGRSSTLLKVKEFTDAEALVLNHEMGQGRNQFRMGAIHCELPNGKHVRIGTGFSDAQRNKPPKKGSIVSFKYQELSDEGIPRFPVFLRVREDVTWDELKKNAADEPEKKKIKAGLLERKHSLLYTAIDRTNEPKTGAGAGAGAGGASTSTSTSTSTAMNVDGTPQRAKRQLSIANAMETLADPSPNKKAKIDAWNILNNVDTDDKGGNTTTNNNNTKNDGDDGDNIDKRPLCKYGLQCYRKDPTHFAKFAHPTKPNAPAAAATATATAAASSSTPASPNVAAAAAADANADDASAEAHADNGKEETAEYNEGRELRRTSLRTTSRTDTLPLLPVDEKNDQAFLFKILLVPAATYERQNSLTASRVVLNKLPVPGEHETALEPITLPDGETVVGRLKYNLASPHISKAHMATFTDLMGGGLEVEPKGMNEIFIRERTAEPDAPNSGFIRISKNERRRCFNGDCIALLPDLSHRFYVKIILTDEA